MKNVRLAIACCVVLLLSGCHDHHGHADWSSGVMTIDIDGLLGPSFSCDDPGGSRLLSNDRRQLMCGIAEQRKSTCGGATTASFGIRKDPNAEGEYLFDFACGQTDHHP